MKTQNLAKTFLFMLFVSASSQAITITDLYNTGVDASGNALGGFVADSHYRITSPTNFVATTVIVDGFPIPPWVANTAQSRWIGPANNNAYGPDAGQMTFSTSFTLDSNADLSTAFISGLGAVDDALADVRINGISLGSLFNGFSTLQNFSISSGFVTGLNTLDFIVQNSSGFGNANPTGLRIQGIVGSYELKSSVPEPTVSLLLGTGLMGLIGIARRRKSLHQ